MDVTKGSAENTVVYNQKRKMSLTIKVNGIQYHMLVNPTDKVIDLLRDRILLFGTKESCGVGRCGACTILLEGQTVNSCLLMAYQVNGKSMTTIEGVGGEELDYVQEAFLKEGAFQCGYCTSGMIMAVKNLLETNLSPSEEEIKEALAGNICRCTGYGGIIRAVQSLASME